MNRRYLAVFALGTILVLTGCLGGGGPSDAELRENASYDWNTTANATITLHGDSYQSVYRIDNDSSLNVYQRDMFNKREPLAIRALRFQYPNGTVVTIDNSSLDASTNRHRTKLSLPNRTGTVAFTADQDGKSFRTPTFVDGSYEVVLPPNTDVTVPILSHVAPGGYETEEIDGKVHVTWSEVDGDTVVVEYYLNRDLLIFGVLFTILVVVGIVGSVYVWRQVKELERRRKEYGLDVDAEDDEFGDDGPPPGMQ